MRLNAKKRLGIVLSVACLIGTTGWCFYVAESRWEDARNSEFRWCKDQNFQRPDYVQYCLDQTAQKIGDEPVADELFKAAGIGLVMTMLIWLLFAVTYLPVKWVLAGREAASE